MVNDILKLPEGVYLAETWRYIGTYIAGKSNQQWK